jgi:hypothetical protein
VYKDLCQNDSITLKNFLSWTFYCFFFCQNTINEWPRILISVAEPHQFYAAPGDNFDAAPAAPAPAPTLMYSKAKFLKRIKIYTHVETILFI